VERLSIHNVVSALILALYVLYRLLYCCQMTKFTYTRHRNQGPGKVHVLHDTSTETAFRRDNHRARMTNALSLGHSADDHWLAILAKWETRDRSTHRTDFAR
jgi:hypothetical protein